jgi:Domain of unknown function (DUF4258)
MAGVPMAIVDVLHESVLGCQTVALDEHAAARMRERSVSADEVLEVLRNPDTTGLPTQPKRFRFRKTLAGRRIDVVFEHDPTQIVVITVIAD